MYIWRLKSLAITGILEKILSPSKGRDSILESINRIKLSIPDDGSGKLLSYAASSPAFFPPLGGAF
jgi:hypothetical protein